MNIDLTDTTAVITGSSDGIGFACAQALAESGADVVINGRSDATVERALEKLRREFPRARFSGIAADMSTAEGPARIIEAAPECDILINNCAVSNLQDVLEEPDEMFFRLFEINFMSGVRLTRHYLPLMLRKIVGACSFTIPSRRCGLRRTWPPMAQRRPQSCRLRDRSRNVRAAPPSRQHDRYRTHALGRYQRASRPHCRGVRKTTKEVEEDFFRNYRPASLLQRLAEGREVANMVVYLSSPYASATNGAVLSVEGGVREVIF